MNYLQHISQAMLKMGDEDHAGAEAEFELALQAAKSVDPDGPREAEVLNYMALFHEQRSLADKAAQARAKADAIFRKFGELG